MDTESKKPETKNQKHKIKDKKNRVKTFINVKVFKNLLGIVFLVFVFISGFLLALWYRAVQVKKYRQLPFQAQESDFQLEPPVGSLVGKVSTYSGKVVKEKRDEDEFKNINEDEEVVKGEKIATDDISAIDIQFGDFVQIKLSENTEIQLISTRKENFLIGLKKGGLELEVVEAGGEISFRALNVLVVFEKGKGEININNNLILVDVDEGKTKVAIVDLANETEVYEIKEGQSARINDLYRRVEIY
jgi:hypothetical protein